MEHLRSFFFPVHEGLPLPTLEAFWPAFLERAKGLEAPVDRAIAAGALAPSVGLAFVGGYQAALLRLFGERAGGGTAALLVTERGGNHPKAIETRLERLGQGRLSVSGEKRWVTGATLASRLFVAATEGKGEDGRNRLRMVEVPADARGVTMKVMPPTPFAAEIPHAEVSLDRVEVPASALLPGDGYDTYVKPFRTVEDLHVLAACAGHAARVSAKRGLSPTLIAELFALLASVRDLAALPPSGPLVHLSVHGAFSHGKQLFAQMVSALSASDPGAGERLAREGGLLEVAQKARDQRLEAALRALAASSGG